MDIGGGVDSNSDPIVEKLLEEIEMDKDSTHTEMTDTREEKSVKKQGKFLLKKIKSTRYFWPVIAIVIIIAVLAGTIGFGVFEYTTPDAIIYFNAYSELPDQTLAFRQVNVQNMTTSGKSIHELEVGKTYGVDFTIDSNAWPEDAKLIYEINSPLLKKMEELVVDEENKSITIHLDLKPTEEDLEERKDVSTEITDLETSISITENSWLAETRKFQVVIDPDATPFITVIEESYNLPISMKLSSLGKVYHIENALEELKKKPFKKTYTSKIVDENSITDLTEEITLSVADDKLHVSSRRVEVTQTTLPETFAIKLYEPRGVGIDDIDERTGKQMVDEISFLYTIREK